MKSTDKNPCCPGATFTRGQNDTYWCGNCGKPFKDPTEPENKIKLPRSGYGITDFAIESLELDANRQHDELCKTCPEKLREENKRLRERIVAIQDAVHKALEVSHD